MLIYKLIVTWFRGSCSPEMQISRGEEQLGRGVDPKDCVDLGGGASVGAGADTILGLVGGTSTARGGATSILAGGA